MSDRLEFQIHQFLYFLPAEAFDADFLLHFLENYHRHAEHITRHFSAKGNHLLFEAQRLVFAGVFFPEFRDADRWRETGVGILNREIGEQVYDDGMQYELDLHYHHESIGIFFKALQMMDANGYRGDFPAEYLATVERMIGAYIDCSFPDYTTPLFSDNRFREKEELMPCYRAWAEVFPDNAAIRWMATEGREGAAPSICRGRCAPRDSTSCATAGRRTPRRWFSKPGRRDFRTASPTTARSTTGAGAATSFPTRAATSTRATRR